MATLPTFFIILAMASIVTGQSHFQLVPNWPDPSIPALKVYGSGVALDFEGNLLVLHRGGIMLPGYPPNTTIPEDVLLVVDAESGKILRSWGRDMFIWPHGIEITQDGDIFVTDSKMHQILKFPYNSTTKLWNTSPILTLGEKFISGADQSHFCTPADVTVSWDQSFFVADGYCNSRIVKFDQNGKYLFEFTAGSKNPNLPPTPFNITHAVALAPRQDQGSGNDFLVFMADRDNSRIQVFTSNGTFLYEISSQDLNSSRAMMFSVSHVPRDGFDYGVIYGVNGYLPWGSAKVFEIGVGAENASLIGSFPTSPDGGGDLDPNVSEAPHDLVASKDGKLIYAVLSIPDRLLIKKYKLVENSAGMSGRIRFGWSIIISMFFYYFMFKF